MEQIQERKCLSHSNFWAFICMLKIDFNDIRTTLQRYTAIYDNCNSLHTNAYDEAITYLRKSL